MLNSHIPVTSFINAQIYYHDLLAAFISHETRITVLSLDCFDTLIWRNVDAPQDVFFTLQHQAIFQSLGITSLQRMIMEDKARSYAYFKQQITEVTLSDIYRFMEKNISAEKINALIDAELAAEIAHCYALPAVIELIRLAKAKNIKIIITSDTYFSGQQLRHLLATKLPLDAFNAIDKIYCSSEYGKSKAQGMFNDILDELSVQPNAVLHIGDNRIADQTAPMSLGMYTLHLRQGDTDIEEWQNMRSWAANFVDQSIRHQRPLYHPFKALVANIDFAENTAEKIIGFASLGPIMYAFGHFLKNELSTLQQAGKRTKCLFLMRDAYLPSLVYKEIDDAAICHQVNISRFSTNAASFVDRQAIELYLSEVVHSGQFKDICGQLLLNEKIAEFIIDETTISDHPSVQFTRLILEEAILQQIISASFDYRKRLFNYLRKNIDIQAGDTLVFIDLGYTGTAQEKLAPILQAEFKVDVIGRYVIALPTPNGHLTKKGLLDARQFDDRLLSMLVRYVALFEQMCTSFGNSVIDYDVDGHPIFSTTSVNQLQTQKTQLLQAACLQFIKQAEDFFNTTPVSLTPAILSETAAIELCRLMYLPTTAEIDYLKSFQFDFNLGTETVLDLFDVEKGVAELRRQGIFFMERNPKKMRTNYPAELRTASLDLAVLLMSVERFKSKLTMDEVSLRREKLPLILVKGKHSVKNFVLALPTFDGYYSATIPLGDGHFQVGIQFGLLYRWVEIESVHLIPASALFSSQPAESSIDVRQFLVADNMQKRDHALYECFSEAAFLAFLPPTNLIIFDHVLRITFRPIIYNKQPNDV